MYYKNGGEHEGEWKDGLRDGKGTMQYPNGDKYEGDWKENKRDGQGIRN